MQQPDAFLGGSRHAFHRRRLPGQHGQVQFQRPVGQPGIGGNLVALFQENQVTRDEPGHIHRLPPPVTDDASLFGEVGRKRLDRPLGLVLLQQGEDGVHQDHGQDRPAQHRHPCHERQSARAPQKQRQRVQELSGEQPKQRAFLAPADLVGPVHRQPTNRLAPRQPPSPVPSSFRSSGNGSRGSALISAVPVAVPA